MADIAILFHWPPSEMERMSLHELAGWWAKARARAPNTEKPDV